MSVLVFISGRPKHISIRDPFQALAIGVFFVSVVVLIVHYVAKDGGGTDKRSAPAPEHAFSPGTVLHVYNKVTSGPRAMRESEEPVYLLTRPAAFCADGKCLIPGTERETGETYESAVCQLQGERVTNGQDNSAVDEQNPGLFSSHRYYEVRLSADTFGYVSEVWVSPKDQGGLGLPEC